MGNQSSAEQKTNTSQEVPQQQNVANADTPQQMDPNCANFQQLSAPPTYQNMQGYGSAQPGLPTRIPTKGYDKEKAVAAVILTVNTGSSYDDLFRAVQQIPPEEEVAISLWGLTLGHLRQLQKKLKKEPLSTEEQGGEMEPLLDEIVSDIERAEPQSVLLNFECCCGFGDGQIPGNDSALFNGAIRLFLDRGHNVNTGDFSTKALITGWDETVLGPNPFIRCGECNQGLTLNFSKKTLQDCPSSQLQQVAELSEKGEARLKAMGGTCLFSVDHAKADTTEYTLEVLTIVSSVDHQKKVSNQACEVKADGLGVMKGCAGHVLLTFPAGGHLVVSSGHWIELSRLDTSVEMVANNLASKYGAGAAEEFQKNFDGFAYAEQQVYLQRTAQNCVQSSAPVSYGNCSKKSSSKW